MKNRSTRKVNFFIIGAAKSGTTSLGKYINEHPDVFMCPKKEPRYFALKDSKDTSVMGPRGNILPLDGITDLEKYRSLFNDASNESIVGDNSPRYMEKSTKSSKHIFQYNPDAKLLAILRNPIDRSYSHFQMNVRSTVEDENYINKDGSLNEGVLTERLSDSFYVKKGMYGEQLSDFLDMFPQSQVKVVLFENLKNNPLLLIKSIYRFLEVDTSFIPDIGSKYNVGGIPKSSWLQQLIKSPSSLKSIAHKVIPNSLYTNMKWYIYKRNQRKAPELPASVHKQLVNHYKRDIRKLQNCVDIDIGHWLEATENSS